MYSLIVFFHSTWGVKQGNPLFPTLFIIIAKVLFRKLNCLYKDNQFIGYEMPKWSTNLNHLAYGDDTIIFTSSNEYSLKMIMNALHEYEEQSSQLVNKQMSFFSVHLNVAKNNVDIEEKFLGINRGSFPMKYIGCPITYSRKSKENYAEVNEKIKGKLQAWKGRKRSPP